MDEAFLELLEKKDFAYITVKEICEKAGVNRSTFYLHYETVNDLLAESTRYFIDRFIEAMPQNVGEFFEKLQTRPLEELYLITPEYLTPYLNYIKDHKRLFCTMHEKAYTLGMDGAYLRLNRYVFSPILSRFHVPTAEHEYMMQFYLNGLMGIVNLWLQDDCKDSVEHIIAVMQTCIPSTNRRNPIAQTPLEKEDE